MFGLQVEQKCDRCSGRKGGGFRKEEFAYARYALPRNWHKEYKSCLLHFSETLNL